MPFYEYRCSACGESFVTLRPMPERDEPIACPECGAHEVERAMSTFSACMGGQSRTGGDLPCGGSGVG
jgi:putative FmdB family regulatory protein